jgi:hypothetical protein
MEPHYRCRHDRQAVGLEGLDLAAARRSEILSSAKDILPDSILQFDHIQFHVASRSRPGEYYAIDLQQSTCECADFPRVRFCKHIAAIYAHFPHLSPEGIPASLLTEDVTPSFQPECAPSAKDSLEHLTQDIAALSQTLASKSSSSAILEAARSAKYTLTAAIASTEGSSALPEKDFIAPNQKSWTETAERMGVKRGARRRKCLPEERGITAQSIGAAKGKRRRVHSDPYAGGERSGKRAKPDATSAAANACARACAAPPSATAPTPSVSPKTLAPPSSTMPAPSAHPEALAFAFPSSAPAPAFAFPSQSAPTPALPSFAKVSFPTTRTCIDAP